MTSKRRVEFYRILLSLFGLIFAAFALYSDFQSTYAIYLIRFGPDEAARRMVDLYIGSVTLTVLVVAAMVAIGAFRGKAQA